MNINDVTLNRIIQKVMDRLALPLIPLEASGRHVHLTREAIDALYGRGYQLNPFAALSQPGQFSCAERVRVVGPKGEFPSVVVLGPERSDTQLEFSLTDAKTLGLDAPIRLSGNITDTPGVRLVGPKGEYVASCGAIVAQRHIHVTPDFARLHGLADKQKVSVRVDGERPVTFHNVVLRVSPNYDNFMHIDYDEANACAFKKGMTGTIIT